MHVIMPAHTHSHNELQTQRTLLLIVWCEKHTAIWWWSFCAPSLFIYFFYISAQIDVNFITILSEFFIVLCNSLGQEFKNWFDYTKLKTKNKKNVFSNQKFQRYRHDTRIEHTDVKDDLRTNVVLVRLFKKVAQKQPFCRTNLV